MASVVSLGQSRSFTEATRDQSRGRVRVVTSTEIAVLAQDDKTLDELAQLANQEHEATCHAAASVLGHAIACGEAVLQAHRIVHERKGRWENWVNDHLLFGPTHASNYARLAHYKNELPEEALLPWVDGAGMTRQPSLTHALLYVRGLPRVFNMKRDRISEETRRECRRLRERGVTYTAIGELLEINAATAHRICDPQAEARHKMAVKRKQRGARAARKALREQETRETRDRAAAKAGGALGETYSLIRRAAQKADEAAMATGDPEARKALRDTQTHLHAAEDAIGRALRIPDLVSA